MARDLSQADLAYIAALLDAFALLRLRDVNGTSLPQVTIQSKRVASLDWLAEVTGVAVMGISKDFHRHQCTDHCPTKHTRIEAKTRRWQLTGARATIVLHAVEPFMRVQGREARLLVEEGLTIGYKTDVVNEMRALGWAIPELKEQPRARVAVAS